MLWVEYVGTLLDTQNMYRALSTDGRRDTRRFLGLSSNTQVLEGLGRHSQGRPPRGTEVVVLPDKWRGMGGRQPGRVRHDKSSHYREC